MFDMLSVGKFYLIQVASYLVYCWLHWNIYTNLRFFLLFYFSSNQDTTLYFVISNKQVIPVLFFFLQ